VIFETILNQAAQLAAEKEARTEALKEQRRQEVYGDLGKRSRYPKVPGPAVKGVDRRNGHSTLDPHREYIISARKKGVTLKEIADYLYKIHNINISQTHISKYYIAQTGHTIGKSRFKGGSVLDDHHEFIADCMGRGMSYPEIAEQLKQFGIEVWPQTIGQYWRKKGIKQ